MENQSRSPPQERAMMNKVIHTTPENNDTIIFIFRDDFYKSFFIHVTVVYVYMISNFDDII